MRLLIVVMWGEGAWHDVFGDVDALWVRLFADMTQSRGYNMWCSVRKRDGGRVLHVLSSRGEVLRDEMSSPEANHGLLFMKRRTPAPRFRSLVVNTLW